MRRCLAFASLSVAAAGAACHTDAGQVYVLADGGGATTDATTTPEGGMLSEASPGTDATSDVTSADATSDVTSADATLDVTSADDTSDVTAADSPMDGTTDANTAVDAADAGSGVVTVAITRPTGAPDVGVHVVFSNPDGTFLGEIVTDSNGRAKMTIPSGGMVTALMEGNSSAQVVTVTSTQPGDVIHLVDPTTPDPSPQSQSLLIDSVTWRSDGGVPDNYELLGVHCVGGPMPPFPSTYSCSAPGQFPILIRAAFSTPPNTPDGYTFLKGQSFPTDGGGLTYTFDGPWPSTVGLDVTVRNLPPMPFLVFDVFDVAYTEYATGGFPFDQAGSVLPYQIDADAGIASVTFRTDPGYPDFTQTMAKFTEGYNVRLLATRTEGTTPTSLTFDYSQVLPKFLSVGLDSTTNPGSLVAYWIPAAPMTSADGIYLQISGTIPWTILAPPDATSVRLPVLSSWGEVATGVDNTIIGAVQVSTLGGYAAFRQSGAAFVPSYCRSICFGGAQPLVLPMGATYSASMFY
jgi:hypothetical protein